MLIDVDDYLNGDKEINSKRVIKQIKIGLHTCPELTVWTNSVKAKYVKTSERKVSDICLIFASLCFGSTLFFLDFGTDIIVNVEWRGYASHNSSRDFKCSGTLHDYMDDELKQTLITFCNN